MRTTQAQKKSLHPLLNFLRESRGFDFSVYKESSLQRRIQRRMEDVHCKAYEAYLDYLQVHPDEFAHLLNTILINVTTFFRDPPIWDYVAKHIIPDLLKKSRNVRVWSAGCASGEEPYTLAILLAEAIGLEAMAQRVKLYATDIDDTALTEARRATYRADAVKGMPEKLRKKYFDMQAGHYVVKTDLRRTVIFGRHNLVTDPPIPHLDLIVCRNTLMYFTSETQADILDRCAFALNDDGLLIVGRAEMIMAHNENFIPFKFNTKFRIFKKSPHADDARHHRAYETPRFTKEESKHLIAAGRQRSSEALSGIGSVAQIQLDPKGKIVQINQHAQSLLGLGKKAMGKPFTAVDLTYKPRELRVQIERVYKDNRAAVIKNVRCDGPGGEQQNFDVEIVPLLDKSRNPHGISIFFYDVTNITSLKTEHVRAIQELETAYEELQAGNEELQSTNEELETTNEELQSANEELETMNEELQSSNEELRSVNDKLNDRTQEANQLTSFLQSVLGSLNAGVAVLDRGLIVTAWNHTAEDLWGLRQEEAKGQHFTALDIGFPVQEFFESVRGCLDGKTVTETVLQATNRRGKPFKCRAGCSPLLDGDRRIQGVIVFMEVQPRES